MLAHTTARCLFRALSLVALGIAASAPGCGGKPDGATVLGRAESALTIPLVGRWPLNEGAGQTAHDTSGHGIDADAGDYLQD